MKKLLTIALLVLASQGIFAQDKLTLGVELGANLSSFNNETELASGEYNSITRLAGGLSVMYDLTDNIYLKSGLNYAQKGQEFKITVFGENPNNPADDILLESVSYISTLSIPLYIGYRTSGTTRFFTNGGAFFSFVTNSELFMGEDTDFGLGLGLGIEHDFSDTQGLRLEIRNEFGLADINGAPIDNAKISTNSLGLFLSYQVKL